MLVVCPALHHVPACSSEGGEVGGALGLAGR